MQKNWLIGGVLALILGILNTTVHAEKSLLLKMQVYIGTHLTGIGSIPVWLVEYVNAASGGSLKIKIYEPDRLVPTSESLQAVHSGQVNAGFTGAGGVLCHSRVRFVRSNGPSRQIG